MSARGAVEGGHRPHDDPAELVALADYRREVLGRIGPLEAIELRLLEAHGSVLAEDVVASAPVPGFANSAMDGYAVRSDDAAAGVALDVVGEVAAGSPELPPVGPRHAVRIMTGAPMPPGADAVVPVEDVEEGDGQVRLRSGVAPGACVRLAGEDVTEGDTVLEVGRRLGPADIGMLAAVGRALVRVHPRPRVAVISTGDELVEPGQPLRPGQIRDANSYALTALAREAGATAFRQSIVPDDRRALLEAFEGALSHADLLVTSGGVSAGRYDLVKQVLAELGDVAFTKVAMRPGMPQAFGFLAGTTHQGAPIPCFGLPGNPVSAYVSFEVFVRPAIRRMQGRTDLNRLRVQAVVETELRSPPDKVEFVRVVLRHTPNGWVARPTGAQGSGILRSVVDADGLAEVPAGHTLVRQGEPLVVHLLVEHPGAGQ
ncbi:MAG TPA: gephyrin-like molybdotransferase Glp [Egibacteraceae bacterium]|nr:gephyrin-like molybdotransferase Glp [Egibacteraceae bacterium]